MARMQEKLWYEDRVKLTYSNFHSILCIYCQKRRKQLGICIQTRHCNIENNFLTIPGSKSANVWFDRRLADLSFEQSPAFGCPTENRLLRPCRSRSSQFVYSSIFKHKIPRLGKSWGEMLNCAFKNWNNIMKFCFFLAFERQWDWNISDLPVFDWMSPILFQFNWMPNSGSAFDFRLGIFFALLLHS